MRYKDEAEISRSNISPDRNPIDNPMPSAPEAAALQNAPSFRDGGCLIFHCARRTTTIGIYN